MATIVVEFGASTLLYERASELSLREDEAHRLAEHLVVARKLLDEWPQAQRSRIARELVTDRYRIGWISWIVASRFRIVSYQSVVAISFFNTSYGR